MPHIRAGKIVPLAWTGAKRAAELIAREQPVYAKVVADAKLNLD